MMLLAIETSKWKYGGIIFPWTADPTPSRPPAAQAEA